MTSQNIAADPLTLTLVREFAAPRALLFSAWTDPKHRVQWFAPRGYTVTHFESDVRRGGAWRSCMHNDETGEDMWHGGAYVEVVSPERLSFTMAWDGDDGLPETEFLITITFTEHAGKTTMTFVQTGLISAQSRDNHGSGWSSEFDRLSDIIDATPTITITRRFHASRERVYAAWSDAQQLAQWWGPESFTNPICDLDFRVGGHMYIVMRSPEGQDFPCYFAFTEIDAPRLLAYRDVDPPEGPLPWTSAMPRPPKQHTTVTFDERDGITTMIVQCTLATPADRDTMVKLGFIEGMSSSLDTLKNILSP